MSKIHFRKKIITCSVAEEITKRKWLPPLCLYEIFKKEKKNDFLRSSTWLLLKISWFPVWLCAVMKYYESVALPWSCSCQRVCYVGFCCLQFLPHYLSGCVDACCICLLVYGLVPFLMFTPPPRPFAPVQKGQRLWAYVACVSCRHLSVICCC